MKVPRFLLPAALAVAAAMATIPVATPFNGAAAASGDDSFGLVPNNWNCARISTDKQHYETGETVTMTLANHCRTNLPLSSSAPWIIEDENGQRVFSPIALMVYTQLPPGSSRSWQWNQKVNNGELIPPGTYIAAFSGIRGASHRFTIGEQRARGRGGIIGHVTYGPICPSISIGHPCPDRPYQTDISIVEKNSGVEVRRVSTDAYGVFRVPLAAGTYTLTPNPDSGKILPRGISQDVTVYPGQYSYVTLMVDSGIRTPAVITPDYPVQPAAPGSEVGLDVLSE